jgi:hypothetical protein
MVERSEKTSQISQNKQEEDPFTALLQGTPHECDNRIIEVSPLSHLS